MRVAPNPRQAACLRVIAALTLGVLGITTSQGVARAELTEPGRTGFGLEASPTHTAVAGRIALARRHGIQTAASFLSDGTGVLGHVDYVLTPRIERFRNLRFGFYLGVGANGIVWKGQTAISARWMVGARFAFQGYPLDFFGEVNGIPIGQRWTLPVITAGARVYVW